MIVTARPSDLASDKIKQFVKFVADYGDIPNKEYIGPGVRSARELFHYFVDDKLVGVAAIKRPQDRYRAKTFKKAGSLRRPELFNFELGYIAVHPDYRCKGIGTRLIKAALETIQDQPIFATSKEVNDKIHRRLEKHGFVREGKSYEPEKGDYRLILFLRENLGQISMLTVGLQ